MIQGLIALEQSLLAAPAPLAGGEASRSDTGQWLAEADRLGCSPPLLLSIGQQSRNLAALLQSRRFLIVSIEALGGLAP